MQINNNISSEGKPRPDCGVYGRVFQTTIHRYDTRAIKDVETEKHSITRREGGYLCIYEKARGNGIRRKALNKLYGQTGSKDGHTIHNAKWF